MVRTAASTSTSPSRSRWATIGWVLAVLATAVTGLVVGYGALWFQLGSGPVVEDYQVSAGGYGAAAVLLLLPVPALLSARRPVLAAATGVVAVLYAWLARNSWQAQLDAVDHGLVSNDAWDGIGGVLLSPTTWPLLFLALRTPYLMLGFSTALGGRGGHRRTAVYRQLDPGTTARNFRRRWCTKLHSDDRSRE